MKFVTAVLVSLVVICCLPVNAGELVLGHIEVRGYKITITSQGGEKGYRVASVDGTQLSARLSAEQLQQTYPDIHRKLFTAVADGAMIWAGQ